jgi:tripartite-type tricarboxylate transporter receptor subunit TctC
VLQWRNKAANEVLQSPDVNARFSAMRTTVEAGTLEDARRYVAADRARWRKVIQDAQIQPE